MDKIFCDGLIAKKPNEKAPDFIKATLSIKVADFKAWLDKHEANNGWLNIDIKEARDGVKWYAELNQYKPEPPQVAAEDSSVPF